MFSLLIESLSRHYQSELLGLSLDRQGKGLTCSPFFLELTIDEILYGLFKKLSEYQKSYCVDRLKYFGIQRIVDVLHAFAIVHRHNPLGGWNSSMNKHGNDSNGDISYVIHELRNADFNLVRSIDLVKFYIL